MSTKEELVKKRWDCGESQDGEVKAELIATNKRLIYTISDKEKISQKEVAIDKITGITTYYKQGKMKSEGLIACGVIMMVLCAILFFVRIVMSMDSDMEEIGVILLFVGIIGVIIGLILTCLGAAKTAPSFSLRVTTTGNDTGALNIGREPGGFDDSMLIFGENEARQIISEIGAFIFDENK